MSKFKDIDEELAAAQKSTRIIDKVETVGIYILAALASTIAVSIAFII